MTPRSTSCSTSPTARSPIAASRTRPSTSWSRPSRVRSWRRTTVTARTRWRPPSLVGALPSTPTLERFGRDLVGLAREGKLGPIVGRERELDAIVEVLLRRTKRNPILLGPAGSGKTAIVEGLAIRIAAGSVPEGLRDIRIFDVPLLSLAPGSRPSRRCSAISWSRSVIRRSSSSSTRSTAGLAEGARPGRVAQAGAGPRRGRLHRSDDRRGVPGRSRIGDGARPPLHGDPVEPMDATAVHAVLDAVRDGLARQRGVVVSDAALDELVALAEQFLPNRSFPDKGVDLIEQSVAYALTHGTEVDVATRARPWPRSSACRSTRPGARRAGRRSCGTARSSTRPPRRAARPSRRLLARTGRSPGAARCGRAPVRRRLGRGRGPGEHAGTNRLRPRNGRHRHRALGHDDDSSISSLLGIGAGAHRLGSTAATPRAPTDPVAGRPPARRRRLRDLHPGRRSRLRSESGAFTDAMGRRSRSARRSSC